MKSNEVEEQILWQGRPAPRCYTFQYWKQALLGSILFLASSFWLMLAFQLMADGEPGWLILLPLPLSIASFIFGPLQLLIARWRWPHIFYQLTERQLSLSSGGCLPLTEITDIRVKKLGERLASLRISTKGDKALVLHCIEQPDQLLVLLNKHCPQLKV